MLNWTFTRSINTASGFKLTGTTEHLRTFLLIVATMSELEGLQMLVNAIDFEQQCKRVIGTILGAALLVKRFENFLEELCRLCFVYPNRFNLDSFAARSDSAQILVEIFVEWYKRKEYQIAIPGQESEVSDALIHLATQFLKRVKGHY